MVACKRGVGQGSARRGELDQRMDLSLTATLAALAAALTVLFGWLGARPAKPLSRPRLVPWRLLMVLAFAATVAMLVHAVALVRGR